MFHLGTENDWTFEDAIESDAVKIPKAVPSLKDLRENWWKINNQGSTGACVGFANAYGVLRWHYAKTDKIKNGNAIRSLYLDGE